MTAHPWKDSVTKGPWDAEPITSEGSYGQGDEDHTGFKAYAVTDGQGRLLFDTLNRDSRVSSIQVQTHEDGVDAWDELARADLTLAAEAGTVLNETGLTPRELADQRGSAQSVFDCILRALNDTTGANGSRSIQYVPQWLEEWAKGMLEAGFRPTDPAAADIKRAIAKCEGGTS